MSLATSPGGGAPSVGPAGAGVDAGADADADIPAGPGVFQIRVAHGLLAYPRGRSAMVAYGAGDDVRAALAAFTGSEAGRAAQALGPLLVRFAVPDPHETPASHLARLTTRFIDQFGAPPRTPEPLGLSGSRAPSAAAPADRPPTPSRDGQT